MRLRAEWRRAIERVLRVSLLAGLALALWRSLEASAAAGRTIGVTASAFDRGMARVLSVQAALPVALDVDAAPSRAQRDLLRALRRSGSAVTWSGEIPPVAIEVAREREPFADGRITAISDGRSPLVFSDSAGPLDTVRSGVATLQVGTLVGSIRAAHGKFIARARVPAPEVRRAVLVLGRVGWEVKFVSAALAEAGWTIRASSPAAPTVTVQDEQLLPIDTARYDAVIAMDSTAAGFANAISAFVAQGGGLVALGTALDIPVVRDLGPARAGERRPGRILLAEDTVTTRDLPSRALVNVRSDAVMLAREPQGVVLAAHRVGTGRVLAVGYDETWRWRMLGGESGMALHREWWSHAVGAVAPARDSRAAAGDGDAAPRVAMIDAIGAPSAVERSVAESPAGNRLPLLLLALIAAALVIETGSRRLRGAP